MTKKLITLNDNNEVRMTSKELCELINMFRAEEGNDTVKEHKDLMRSIRAELEVLANAGIDNGGNFALVDYTDSKGEKRPCYSLTKDAVMQMLNKESAVVRYKTQQYIKALEKQLMAHALPTPEVPQINYDKYNKYNFKQYLQAIKVKDIPEETTNFIQAHESDTPDERLAIYKIAKNALEEIKTTLTESWQILMVQATLDDLNKKIELQKTYINRTRLAQQTKRIKKLQEEIRHYELDSFDNYQQFNLHPYTINTAYRAVDNKIECSKSYKQWKTNAAKELENLPTLEELGVNPNEYMKIDIWFYMRDESFDVDNQIKSFIDALKKHYDFDDKMIADVHARKYLTYSETFDNGCVYFALKNLDPIEIQTLTDGEL